MKRLARLVWLVAAVFMGGCDRSFIYYPERLAEARLRPLAQAAGLEPWTNAAGERIGWKTPVRPSTARSPRPAVILFHGNAGHAAQRAAYVAGFQRATEPQPWPVYLMEYPGYGSRPGEPSEPAFVHAAEEALAALSPIDHPRVYLAGESLGSGVACALAAQRPNRVAGLLLVTPFSSLREVARQHYPGWMVNLLLRERYDNAATLSRFTGPVAFLLAENDEIVPSELGRKLHDGYTGPKLLRVQAGQSHNTLSFNPTEAWWREVIAFWKRNEK